MSCWKFALLSLLCEDIQWQESVHCYAKTPSGRKVYIAITFVLCTDIRCEESLHCYHVCIVRRHPVAGKGKFLSLLYYAQTSNVRKVYIAIIYAKTSYVMKVCIAITFVLCTDIQWQESVHYYHFCIVHESVHYYHFVLCMNFNEVTCIKSPKN